MSIGCFELDTGIGLCRSFEIGTGFIELAYPSQRDTVIDQTRRIVRLQFGAGFDRFDSGTVAASNKFFITDVETGLGRLDDGRRTLRQQGQNE